MDYQPDFTVSAAAISMVAEISALIERYTITQEAVESVVGIDFSRGTR